MNKVQLDIIGISYSQTQSGAYALILGESKGKRRLPIIIGAFEAQAIAIELEKMKPSRPLTHDLFKNFASEFEISISEVIIYKFSEGIFYSKIFCISEAKEVEIDSRTSDAIALAVRFNCPIFTFEKILKEAAVIFDENEEAEKENITEPELENTADNEFSSFNDDELEELLKTAVDEEDYEKASKIRDELNKRNL